MNLDGNSPLENGLQAYLVFVFSPNLSFVWGFAKACLEKIKAVFRANRSDLELGASRAGNFSE